MVCFAGASSSLGLIHRQAIETPSLGNGHDYTLIWLLADCSPSMSKPVFPGERVRLAINKLPDLLQNYLGRNSASRQPFSVRKTVSLLEGLEADHQQSPDCSTRLCLAFCGSTPSVQQTSRDSSSCHFFKS